jgi:soluble lytic murein transglycosylase-like protein
MVAFAIVAGYAVAALLVLVPRMHSEVVGPNHEAGLVIAPPLLAVPPADSTVILASAVAAPAIDSAQLERQAIRLFAHGPLARVLGGRTSSPELADSIARALVREARRIRVAPSLLAAVLLTENPALDPDTVNQFGATGLMQVMPFHAGEYGCRSDDLQEVDANICHGAQVLGRYMKRTGNVRSALLRYNGCVRSTNTPRCERYPSKVLTVAHRVRRQMLTYAARERELATSR